MMKLIKLDLKLQCKGQVYVIIVIHIYLLKEQLQTQQNCAPFIKCISRMKR